MDFASIRVSYIPGVSVWGGGRLIKKRSIFLYSPAANGNSLRIVPVHPEGSFLRDSEYVSLELPTFFTYKETYWGVMGWGQVEKGSVSLILAPVAEFFSVTSTSEAAARGAKIIETIPSTNKKLLECMLLIDDKFFKPFVS